MSYQPLARKYRPAKFSDLVGQDSVAKALAGAINLNRLHPSIIFSGVRGIGKTTTARLLAKALCCDEGVSAEPCGVCESCRAVSIGTHEDVLEIDGASNNGVDEVRSLKESVSYIPQRGKYKVYIIDEVHMLSVSAFNALLKTLEEPPPNVIFVFATTELHKVPATVVGRCLTFHLKKFTNVDIVKRVKHILELEKITYEESALSVVAREGHGSMRDALTFLDQVIAIGDGNVTMESIKGIVSSISSDPYLDILQAMVVKDAQKTIDLVESLDEAGVIFGDVAKGVAEFSRHGFILKGLGKDSLEKSLLGLTEDEILRLAEISDKAQDLDFHRIFRVVQNTMKQLDGSDLDRFTFENCLLEWCFDPGFPTIDELLKGGGINATPQGAGMQTQMGDGSSPGVNASAGLRHKPKKSLVKSLMAELKKDDTEAVKSASEEKKINQPSVSEPTSSVSKGISHPAQVSQIPKPVNTQPVMEKQNLRAKPAGMREKLQQEVMQQKKSMPPIGRAPQQEIKKAEPQPSQPATTVSFPETWRALVDLWKRLKPIQARKLEEVHPLKYGREEILVAVEAGGMIGIELMKPVVQQHLTETFRELFGFEGIFKVISKNQAKESNDYIPVNEAIIPPPVKKEEPIPQVSMSENAASMSKQGANVKKTNDLLPETIEQQKTKESQKRRQEILNAAKEHQLTKSLMNHFQGEIVDIIVKDPKASYGASHLSK